MNAALAQEILSDGTAIRVARAKPKVAVVIERDSRALNHMDPDTKAVHFRLQAWASWARDGGYPAWPSVTVLARMIEQGVLGAAQESRPPICMPDEIAHTDKAVANLGDIDRRTVLTYYLHWEPIECSARRMHMRVRQFQNVLRRARWRIGGFLAALEQ